MGPLEMELRDTLEGIGAAYNAGDLDRFVSYFEDPCFVTWQNAAVSKNRKQIKQYLREMTQDRLRAIDSSSIHLLADGLSAVHLDQQTAIASGRSMDHYELSEGAKYDQWTRWSATLVKRDGRWQVASLHLSVDMFDNPVLAMVFQRTAWWTGGIAGGVGLVVGLVLGWVAGRVGKRRMTKPEVG
jgi:ketosteroid isomerase-like protein